MVAAGGRVPEGWYPDPLGLQQLRWWDGGAWTSETSPLAAAPQEPAPSETPESAEVPEVSEPGDVPEPADVSEPAVVGDSASASEPAVVSEPAEVPEPAGAPDPAEDPAPIAEHVVPDFSGEGRGEAAQEQAASGVAVAGRDSEVVVPEPYAPVHADPFAAAQANALVFTTRRARRAYERKRELEAGLPDRTASPYAQLDTNPIDIPLRHDRAVSAPTGRPDAAVAPAATAGPPGGEPNGAAVPAGPASPTVPGDALGSHDDAPSGPPSDTSVPDGAAEPTFSLEDTPVSPELAPARTLIGKRTYSFVGYLMAMLPPLALLAIIALELVPQLTQTAEVAWGVLAAAYVIGALLAFLDSAALRRWGHARTASPLWALLTPVVYLSVRAVATRRESGHGRAVVLAWVLGLLLAALLATLFPEALSRIVPGFEAPWTSLIG